MGDALVGSRYALHVARRGMRESRLASDYRAVHPGDSELDAPSDDPVGYVHSYEVGSTADGPGLRFVAMLTGCHLRCPYCHNPDAWHKYNGHPVTVSRVMRTIGRYATGLRGSGGITLSGGEPLLQRTFLLEILRQCRVRGLHTCVDTAGYLGDALTDDDLELIDLQLLDIKGGNPARYGPHAAAWLDRAAHHAQRLSALERRVWLRYVVVPELTSGVDVVESAARFCATLKSVDRVEILPFHQLGRSKWQRLGLTYALAKTRVPDQALVERIRAQFQSHGLPVA